MSKTVKNVSKNTCVLNIYFLLIFNLCRLYHMHIFSYLFVDFVCSTKINNILVPGSISTWRLASDQMTCSVHFSGIYFIHSHIVDEGIHIQIACLFFLYPFSLLFPKRNNVYTYIQDLCIRSVEDFFTSRQYLFNKININNIRLLREL